MRESRVNGGILLTPDYRPPHTCDLPSKFEAIGALWRCGECKKWYVIDYLMSGRIGWAKAGFWDSRSVKKRIREYESRIQNREKVGDRVSEWKSARWFRVTGPDKVLWAETSDKKEAISRMRPGDSLFEMQTRSEHRWVKIS